VPADSNWFSIFRECGLLAEDSVFILVFGYPVTIIFIFFLYRRGGVSGEILKYDVKPPPMPPRMTTLCLR